MEWPKMDGSTVTFWLWVIGIIAVVWPAVLAYVLLREIWWHSDQLTVQVNRANQALLAEIARHAPTPPSASGR